jgi:hypothetical protein
MVSLSMSIAGMVMIRWTGVWAKQSICQRQRCRRLGAFSYKLARAARLQPTLRPPSPLRSAL